MVQTGGLKIVIFQTSDTFQIEKEKLYRFESLLKWEAEKQNKMKKKKKKFRQFSFCSTRCGVVTMRERAAFNCLRIFVGHVQHHRTIPNLTPSNKYLLIYLYIYIYVYMYDDHYFNCYCYRLYMYILINIYMHIDS